MRVLKFLAVAALVTGDVSVVHAQQMLSEQAAERRAKKEAEEAAKKGGADPKTCANADPNAEASCIKAQNARITANNKTQGAIIAALNAGNAKMTANDFSGAITDYQGALTAAPGHPNLFEVHIALANAYRARAAADFNGAIKPGMTALPPEVVASATGDLGQSLTEAGSAGAMAQAMTPPDGPKLAKVDAQMRESARLWVAIDRPGLVTGAPRPTLDTELALFNVWAGMADTTPQQLVQYTPGIAFPLLTKNKDAALKLADDMFTKSPTDTDATIAYGQIVAEAKLPPTDPRRVKAKAAVENLLATGTTNDQQKIRLKNLRIKFNAAT